MRYSQALLGGNYHIWLPVYYVISLDGGLEAECSYRYIRDIVYRLIDARTIEPSSYRLITYIRRCKIKEWK